MIAASPIECVYARGRAGGGIGRGGGGIGRGGSGHGDFARGDFSRESPAAAGSLASRPEPMRGQANRMEYGQHAQASRQQEANALQSNREQAARNLQNNAQRYRGAYPSGWDAGAGWAAAATGAAIGAAATSYAVPADATAAYPTGQPCANPEAVPVGSTTYFRCGSSWYAQAYGPAGPTFVAVGPPY